MSRAAGISYEWFSENPIILFLIFIYLIFAVTSSTGQEAQPWTERRNLGFKGPVRSVLTTVTRLNPDPRPPTHRDLPVLASADWATFDVQGRRTEFASAVSAERIEAISKCTFRADGSKVCTDSAGHTRESQSQEATLADGSHETTYLLGSKVESRAVTRVDEKGQATGSRNYDERGRLTSEESAQPNGDEEWKLYDRDAHLVSDVKTRISDDRKRFDRWSYDAEGNLVWHLAINDEGELLSDWYEVGYKSKVSSSDSLGIVRPHLSVSYKFDEEGSGRLEKMVQHTSEDCNCNLEPDSEEHYNFDGMLDEKAEIKYVRDKNGNWTSRSVFVWDSHSNNMIEIEQDVRKIEYY